MTTLQPRRTVLWVVGDGAVAGVGRHVLDVVSAGIPGWHVRVLAPEGALLDALPSGVGVVGDFGPEAGLRRSVSDIRRAARTVGADVIHSHLAWADLVCALAGASGSVASRGSRGGPGRPASARSAVTSIGTSRMQPLTRNHLPLVSTEHGIAPDPMAYEARRVAAALTTAAHVWRMRRLAALICVSQATATTVARRWKPPARLPVSVIYNGVDRHGLSTASDRAGEGARVSSAGEFRTADTALGKPTSHPPTVGYLGRFSPEKRVDRLIAAFVGVLHQVPTAQLSLAGAGPEEGALRSQVALMGLSDRVSFEGWVEAATWMPTIDVLCLPSVWENCSYALLEGLAAGIGVVAAPVGGNVEMLPPSAVADPADKTGFARAIADQLEGRTPKPPLPSCVPTVHGMTAEIAEVYERLRHAHSQTNPATQ